MPKEIDLGPGDYSEQTPDLALEEEIHLRETMERLGVTNLSNAMPGMARNPVFPDPPPKPVLPHIKWVIPKIVNGKASYNHGVEDKDG